MTFSAKVTKVQREHPAWTYSQCCAELSRRSAVVRAQKRKAWRPVVRYWWQKD